MSWEKMRARCLNPRSDRYPYYGGRGIRICNRWDSFENFLADMGPKPTPKHTIERVDNSGNYEPSNCVWADMTTQLNNKRTNVRFQYNGRVQTQAQWARELGVSPRSVRKLLTK